MPNDIQQRYWNYLMEIKGQGYYLNDYLIRSERYENTFSVILAIASSTSIAGWAIWSEWSIVWAIIIAASQVINAIRPLLPYGKRIKPLRALVYAIDDVFLRAENKWFHVSNGDLSADEINNLLTDLKKEFQAQWVKQMGDLSLPEDEKLLEIANQRATEYFTVHYNE